MEMIGETEGRDGRRRERRGGKAREVREKEAWKTNEQEPQREFLLVGAGNEAGSLALSLACAPVPPAPGPRSCRPRRLRGCALRFKQYVINS